MSVIDVREEKRREILESLRVHAEDWNLDVWFGVGELEARLDLASEWVMDILARKDRSDDPAKPVKKAKKS